MPIQPDGTIVPPEVGAPGVPKLPRHHLVLSERSPNVDAGTGGRMWRVRCACGWKATATDEVGAEAAFEEHAANRL